MSKRKSSCNALLISADLPNKHNKAIARNESTSADQPIDFSVKSPTGSVSGLPSSQSATETQSHSASLSSEAVPVSRVMKVATRNRRKPDCTVVQRRASQSSSSAVPLDLLIPITLGAVADHGDSSWHGNSSNNESASSSHCDAQTGNIHQPNSSVSISRTSFSSSCNNDDEELFSRMSCPQSSSSIPPDSTTASLDGYDGGKRIKVRTANGILNRRMARAIPNDKKDDSYWQRRSKNNEAAKRSRDARRQKEDDVAFHCRQLELENKMLREEIAELRTVIEQLRAEVNRTATNRVTIPENAENCAPTGLASNLTQTSTSSSSSSSSSSAESGAGVNEMEQSSGTS